MNPVQKKIEAFFHEYELHFNEALSGDEAGIEPLAHAFSSSFVQAGQGGISLGRNNDAFRSHIAKGFGFYKQAGITDMRIGSITSFILDDQHVLARIHWKTCYANRMAKKPIEFDSSYLLQVKPDTIHIFAYINGRELNAIQGLVPATDLK